MEYKPGVNNMEDYIQKIQELGVKNPNSPSVKEMTKILEAYIKTKKIDELVFRNYMTAIKPSLKVLFDALIKVSVACEKTTRGTQTIIEKALNILEAELKRDIPEERRKEITDNILDLVRQAREESKETRTFLKTITIIGVGAFVIVIGVSVYTLTKGKNGQMIAQGIDMITKVL